MFNLEDWLEEIVGKIRGHFCKRVVFLGLQGSYKRGEATAASDVDVVVILDELRIEDLKAYREIVRSMPDYEKACGFISGRAELQNWSKSDLFQFYFETESLYGDLTELIAPPEKDDIRRTVKLSAEALYHAACHSFVFDVRERLAIRNVSEPFERRIRQRSRGLTCGSRASRRRRTALFENPAETLSSLYKMTFFILQAEYYLKNNVYIPTKKELLTSLTGADYEILQTCINMNLVENGIDEMYERLINWCSVRICT